MRVGGSNMTEELGQPFVPTAFYHAWGAFHFNALNRWLPFFISCSELIISNGQRSLRNENFDVGLELTFLKHLMFRIQGGSQYYNGSQADSVSAALSASFTPEDFLSLFKKSRPKN